MKINFKPVVLLSVLCIAAVGCQKETIVEPTNAQIQQSVTIRNVTYTIDGVTMYTTLRGEQSWYDFLDELTRMTEAGHRVSFRVENVNNSQSDRKDVHTFSTKDREKAIAWCAEMGEMGYSVTMEYDETSGVYTCTAVK